MQQKPNHSLFGEKGIAKAPGIGRTAFAVRFLFLLIVCGALNALTGTAIIGSFLFVILLLFPAMKRLGNIGRNPWWALLLLIPLVGLLVIIPCLVLPESYEHHKQLDQKAKVWIGIILTSIVLFAVIFLYGVLTN
jgi:uncharacterized membrane protein YhaH (DUF805 family)